MPKWGLTIAQRKSKPWGLPSELLEPDKTITDPVHGDIYLTRLESLIVDSPPMQRLRRVRQLGTTHLVYPGATHSRFSHSLGALRVAQDLLDLVIDQRNGADSVPDIFMEWESDRANYHRKVAEVTILARLGGLLHDLCHVPFGHSLEDDLKILTPHDENKGRFETLWNQFDDDLRRLLAQNGLASALRPLIISKVDEERQPHDDYQFATDIVGNTICADLLDYLDRDHMFAGLPVKFGRRVLSGFYVTPSNHRYYPARMVMRIARDGRSRNDVVSDLFKYLRYRYELSERALVHHAKLAADAMVGKALEMWKDALWVEFAEQRFGKRVKPPELDIDVLRDRLTKAGLAHEFEGIDNLVQQHLEREFLRYGDDGLLEHLLITSENKATSDDRMNAIAHLVRGLLNRQLFKLAGQFRARQMADTIYKRFGSPEARRQLELRTTKFARLSHRDVVLWVPAAQMRMKAARVLVDDGTHVSTLYDLDHALRDRGREIYESHEDLWSVSVFVNPKVRQDPELTQVVLSYLAQELSIKWTGLPHVTLGALAGRKVVAEMNLPYQFERELIVDHAAYKGGTTWEALVEEKRTIAKNRRAIAQAADGAGSTSAMEPAGAPVDPETAGSDSDKQPALPGIRAGQ